MLKLARNILLPTFAYLCFGASFAEETVVTEVKAMAKETAENAAPPKEKSWWEMTVHLNIPEDGIAIKKDTDIATGAALTALNATTNVLWVANQLNPLYWIGKAGNYRMANINNKQYVIDESMTTAVGFPGVCKNKSNEMAIFKTALLDWEKAASLVKTPREVLWLLFLKTKEGKASEQEKQLYSNMLGDKTYKERVKEVDEVCEKALALAKEKGIKPPENLE